jgi:hypothetical protein
VITRSRCRRPPPCRQSRTSGSVYPRAAHSPSRALPDANRTTARPRRREAVRAPRGRREPIGVAQARPARAMPARSA